MVMRTAKIEPGMPAKTMRQERERPVGYRSSPSVSFEHELRWYDARAFTNGTLPMYAVDLERDHARRTPVGKDGSSKSP